jgi:hypothetical protein
LIKDANNQHTNGNTWEYWLGIQNGYNIIHYDDERLKVASQLLNVLSNQQWADIKYNLFGGK